jgi:hypothetical protein
VAKLSIRSQFEFLITVIVLIHAGHLRHSGQMGVFGYSANSCTLKVHKIENFFDSDFGICVISLLVMSKY